MREGMVKVPARMILLTKRKCRSAWTGFLTLLSVTDHFQQRIRCQEIHDGIFEYLQCLRSALAGVFLFQHVNTAQGRING